MAVCRARESYFKERCAIMHAPGHLVKRKTRNSLTRARNPAEKKTFLRIRPNPLTFLITKT